MGDDYGFLEKRSKKRDKRKRRKMFPYRHGGAGRTEKARL